MKFVILWVVGAVIVIVTKILNRKLLFREEVENSKPMQVIMHLLVILCMVLAGGIPNGACLSIAFVGTPKIWKYVVVGIIGIFAIIVIFVFIYGILRLDQHFSFFSERCFQAVYIISIVCWTIGITKYCRNIETTTETVEWTEERQLMYFCNIPVQEISGHIEGYASGSISTLDKLSYWYFNGNNEGIPDFALTNSSKIVFISEEEEAHLTIIHYATYTKTINHNKGKEGVKREETPNEEWVEYIFYLPEEIMQYPLS